MDKELEIFCQVPFHLEYQTISPAAHFCLRLQVKPGSFISLSKKTQPIFIFVVK